MRTLRFLFALIVILAFLHGCTYMPPQEPVATPPLPTATPQTEVSSLPELRIMLKTNDYVMENWPVMQEFFRYTGANCYIKTVRPDQFDASLSAYLSSGEVFDLMEIDAVRADIYKEHFVNAAPLLSEHAPTMYAWIWNYPDYVNRLATTTGELYIFPLRQEEAPFCAAAFSRGVDAPGGVITKDAFLSLGGDAMFITDGGTLRICAMLAPFFGTSDGMVSKEGHRQFGPFTQEFKDMLKFLNKLYRNGTLSAEFRYDSEPGYYDAMQSPDKKLIAICPAKDFDTAYHFGLRPVMLDLSEHGALPASGASPASFGAISDNNGNAPLAARFLEACFSAGGRQLLNTGMDGVHYRRTADGTITPLAPFYAGGEYSWREQGLTPEGMPGIYYNAWAAYPEELQSGLQNLKAYAADRNSIVKQYPPYGNYAERALMYQTKIGDAYEKWWTEFISGTKSADIYWDIYINEIRGHGVDELNTILYGS